MLTMAICTTSKSCRSLGARLLQPISPPLWQPGDGTVTAGAVLSSLDLVVYRLRVPGCFHTAATGEMPCYSQFPAQTNLTVLMTRPWVANHMGLEGCKCRCKPRDSCQLELGPPTQPPRNLPGSSVRPPECCLPCAERLQERAKL